MNHRINRGGVIIDTVPIEGSNNPISSDAVYDVFKILSGGSSGGNSEPSVPEVDPYEGLPALGTSFTDMTWDEISAVCKAGFASNYFNIGDQKVANIGDLDYAIDIIGFDHDDVTDSENYGREKAGITCQLHICFGNQYPMNSSATNVGGWTSSQMRTSTLSNTIIGWFPTDLRNVMIPVDKKTSAGGQSGTINTDSDILFLPSEIEVFGTTENSVSGEGTQYEYYKNGNSVLKTNGSVYTWWLRSPVTVDNVSFNCVEGSLYALMANSSYGVAPCFCI